MKLLISIKNFREVEEAHAERFKKLYDKLNKETMFVGPDEF